MRASAPLRGFAAIRIEATRLRCRFTNMTGAGQEFYADTGEKIRAFTPPPCRKWLVISRLAIGLHGGWLQGRISLAKITHFFHFHKPHPKNFPKNYTPPPKVSAGGFGWRAGRFLPRRNEDNEGQAHEVYFLRSFVVLKVYAAGAGARGVFTTKKRRDGGLAHNI